LGEGFGDLGVGLAVGDLDHADAFAGEAGDVLEELDDFARAAVVVPADAEDDPLEAAGRFAEDGGALGAFFAVAVGRALAEFGGADDFRTLLGRPGRLGRAGLRWSFSGRPGSAGGDRLAGEAGAEMSLFTDGGLA